MPTKDLEVEVREPAWSHQGSLGSVRATGALVRDVRDHCSAHGCTWGLQAVSRAAGAHFIRRVGTSAIWSLSDEKRTLRGHLETVAIDPERTSGLLAKSSQGGRS